MAVGVQTGDRLVVVSEGDFKLDLLDRVTVLIAGAEHEGEVYITLDGWAAEPPAGEGIVLAVHPRIDPADAGNLPGDRLPPLGAQVTFEGGTGLVIGVDPAGETVVVRTPDGEEQTIPLSTVN